MIKVEKLMLDLSNIAILFVESNLMRKNI